MERNRKEGALERAVARLKEKTERLLGKRPTPTKEPGAGGRARAARDLRQPGDAIRARSGFRQ